MQASLGKTGDWSKEAPGANERSPHSRSPWPLGACAPRGADCRRCGGAVHPADSGLPWRLALAWSFDRPRLRGARIRHAARKCLPLHLHRLSRPCLKACHAVSISDRPLSQPEPLAHPALASDQLRPQFQSQSLLRSPSTGLSPRAVQLHRTPFCPLNSTLGPECRRPSLWSDAPHRARYLIRLATSENKRFGFCPWRFSFYIVS